MAVQRRVDDVLGAVDVGLDGLRRVIFAGRHLLQRGGMDYIVHAVEGPQKPVPVANVPDKESQLRSVFPELVLHDELLEFIPGVDDDFLRIIMGQDIFGESFAEASCPTCNQNGFIV